MLSNSSPVTSGTHLRAFVIQFDKEADMVGNRVKGRIEHVASGKTLHFNSLVELVAFFDRQLKEAQLGAEK